MKEYVVYDIECYVNYFYVAFEHIESGKIIEFERFENKDPLDTHPDIDTVNTRNLQYLMKKYALVGFNNDGYDSIILDAAVQGFNNKALKAISDDIIVKRMMPWVVRKKYGVWQKDSDQIDIMNVAPSMGSLKQYGCRLHSKRVRDLPVNPDLYVKSNQLFDLKDYCKNTDLKITIDLFAFLKEEIDLRIVLSEKYDIDLRSKSDAQISEAVIKAEAYHNHKVKIKKPKIDKDFTFNYKAPDNISFKSDDLNDLLNDYTTRPFTLKASGAPSFTFSNGKSKRIVSVNGKDYTMGLGGIHSKEKKAFYKSGIKKVYEFDVASYYPFIILLNLLEPLHLKGIFLAIYEKIVTRRLKAKSEGLKAIADSLKIVINGAFGKLGSKYSILYAPDLLAQVTITGQLTLLMLIERLELNGVEVISANTDGIVLYTSDDQKAIIDDTILEWELDTGYTMEEGQYKAIASRDVNNYMAIKYEGKGWKGKGAYIDHSDHYNTLRNNPSEGIVAKAIGAYIDDGVDIEETVTSSTDVRDFISTIKLKNGGVWNNEFIGNSIRWYYGKNEVDCIYRAGSRDKVPKSDGAIPLMELPETLPDDIDYSYYINAAKENLKKMGLQ